MGTGTEGFPVAERTEVLEAPIDSIFQQDGSLNEQHLGEQYGIGILEAEQVVTFGTYTGSVAQMLADPRCPVGGMIRTAYNDGGLEGVAQKFGVLNQMDPKFKVEISEETIVREEVKMFEATKAPEPEKKK